MNVGEYGVVCRFNVGFDISQATTLTLSFTKPDGTTLTKTTPNVTAGSTDITSSLGVTFSANQYALYTFAQGDVDQAGAWKARLTYDDGVKHLISNIGIFTVGN